MSVDNYYVATLSIDYKTRIDNSDYQRLLNALASRLELRGHIRLLCRSERHRADSHGT